MDLEVAEHVGECFCVNSRHVQYYILHVQRSDRSHPDAMVGGDEGREEGGSTLRRGERECEGKV